MVVLVPFYPTGVLFYPLQGLLRERKYYLHECVRLVEFFHRGGFALNIRTRLDMEVNILFPNSSCPDHMYVVLVCVFNSKATVETVLTVLGQLGWGGARQKTREKETGKIPTKELN